MTAYSPTDLAAQLKSGLLSFPVTHFTEDLAFDEEGFRKHLAWLGEHPVAGLFAAGATGEGFSLTFEETDKVVRTAVEEVAGVVPVLAPATGSTKNAVAQAEAAAAAGADGLLLMPPYLTEASQAGLVEHVSRVCAATDLGVVVYSRANAVLKDEAVEVLADRNPTLIGFKDGVGNIEQMTRTYARVGDRLTYVGGLPTAETFALPAAAARREHLLLGALQLRCRPGRSSSTRPCVPRTGTRSTVDSTSSCCRTSTSATVRRAVPSRSSRAAWPPSAAPPARSAPR
ncbi:dihydrodipicolinate synthase family protein [Nocardioides euryhalodurans]|uniref:dihydrodipicolinate synthase family protein n=1 Tax=Nocardioides euryhalodurans TaxID=2518370 RepID=UPI001FCA22A0|nr:dihydrodipicolinate synthase family protein [Nocardioides euryhalodurans]